MKKVDSHPVKNKFLKDRLLVFWAKTSGSEGRAKEGLRFNVFVAGSAEVKGGRILMIKKKGYPPPSTRRLTSQEQRSVPWSLLKWEGDCGTV